MSQIQARTSEAQKKIKPARQPEQEPGRQAGRGPVQLASPQAVYRRVKTNRNGRAAADLLALQRTVGNRMVQRLVAQRMDRANSQQQRMLAEENSGITVQTSLMVGGPDDSYEQIADRAADQMMHKPEQPQKRTCACGGECPKCQAERLAQASRHIQPKGVETNQEHARATLGGAVVQRDAKTPAKNTAAGGPKLDFRPAKNPPPCACIVFIHHNEPNARLTAQVMYEFCHYNLAIVDPQTNARNINLPGKGTIDPNELFTRKVAEECWADDKPCEDFLSKHAGSTESAVVEEYAQRQFFLAIKKCSDGFALPVIALHNNTIDETARYRKAVRDSKAPLDLAPIKGKTFDDALKSGEKSAEPNTSPFADLQEWLLKNVPEVSKKKAPKGSKGTLKGGPITPGKTNIFLWCSAADISRCHIGDPERPDNVVWVTNSADFERLRGTKTNVVLQTRVDPAGRSATDLSSLFVFLKEIVGAHFSGIISSLESDVAVDASAIADAIAELRKLQKYDDLTLGNALEQFTTIIQRIIELLLKLLLVAVAQGARAVKLSQLRFINIETPQTQYDATTKSEDLRVQSYRDVRAVLAAVGLDCCDATPATGETESAVEKVEQALREGKLPKA